jgi:hypothetical protein
MPAIRRNQFAPGARRFGRLGITAAQGSTVVAGGIASAVAAGAGAGSVAGPIGTVVGAVVGVVVGILTKSNNTASHIGTWDAQLSQAIGQLPASAAGIGRQIPFNENSHGIVQMIEALLATGIYMAWDPSLITNYDVCAHWSTTFGAAVTQVVDAICANPTGAQVSANITLDTGASGIPNKNFTFTNPGVQVGPDAISAQIIMGNAGLMYWMITAIGETTAHASSNGSNALAQKVFALMVDNVAATLAPVATVPSTPVDTTVAATVVTASTAANAAASAGADPAVAANAAVATTPVAAPAAIPVAATGAPAVSTPVNVEIQDPENQAPAALPVVAAQTGISTNDLLIGGGLFLGVFALYLIMSKK